MAIDVPVGVPPALADILAAFKPAALPPYRVCTHVGTSIALVLPDGDGDLVLYCANLAPLRVHGIAASQKGRPPVNGRKLTVHVGEAIVEFVHQSDETFPEFRRQGARLGDKLTLKDGKPQIIDPQVPEALRAVTTVSRGQAISFEYDGKVNGWRQV